MKINTKTKNWEKKNPQWVPHEGAFLFLHGCLQYKDIFVESIYAIYHVSICVGWDGAYGGKLNVYMDHDII